MMRNGELFAVGFNSLTTPGYWWRAENGCGLTTNGSATTARSASWAARRWLRKMRGVSASR